MKLICAICIVYLGNFHYLKLGKKKELYTNENNLYFEISRF